VYDPASGTWAATTNSLSTARYFHTATLLPNGKVLVVGGIDPNYFSSASADLFDPTIGRWTPTSVMATARDAHTATLLPNGKVLVTGGIGNPSPGSPYLPSGAYGEIFDPATGTWRVIGRMTTTRWYHTATLLPNGKVLVAGGAADKTAELFDPAAGTWTLTGSMSIIHDLHTATLLPSGKVLLVGDYNNGRIAELYDPATGTWTLTGSMTTARNRQKATLLRNGKVLVEGGYDGYAELYDPDRGTWTVTGKLSTERFYHTATLLPNGKVLLAGGTHGDYPYEYLSSADLFDVGPGFSASWQPQIATCTSPLSSGGSLTLTGSRFCGISGASGGNYQDASSDYPVVQLRSIENEQIKFLLSTSWSATNFTSVPVSGLPPGYALATVFVNGIPSTSAILRVDMGSMPTAILLTSAAKLPGGGFQFAFTNTPGASFSVLASANPALPITNWITLGGATEIAPGQFQFTDPQATNFPSRFYRVRSGLEF
jgi:WD40 repeat protein